MKWFRLAADQGDANAQNNLGVMYLKGQGVPQNYNVALGWFNVSAAQGHQEAIRNRDSANRQITGATAKGAERWDVGHRIRDVKVGPDGALWMLEDNSSGPARDWTQVST